MQKNRYFAHGTVAINAEFSTQYLLYIHNLHTEIVKQGKSIARPAKPTGGQLTLREGRHLLSLMELAASMTSLSSVVIILFVVCPTAWCNGVTSSTFMMTKDKQVSSMF